MAALSWRLACPDARSLALSGPMPMNATRLRECLEAPGWSLRELARRLSCDDGTVRQMATDKRPVPDNLAAWLELVHAVWGVLTPELCDIARRMECDRGTFIRRPRGTRPLADGEAALLEALAAFQAAFPTPVGWSSGQRSQMQHRTTA